MALLSESGNEQTVDALVAQLAKELVIGSSMEKIVMFSVMGDTPIAAVVDPCSFCQKHENIHSIYRPNSQNWQVISIVLQSKQI